MDERGVLNGILFVLQTAIPWEDWPQELGWQRHDLLASAGRLEGKRRLGAPASGPADPLARAQARA